MITELWCSGIDDGDDADDEDGSFLLAMPRETNSMEQRCLGAQMAAPVSGWWFQSVEKYWSIGMIIPNIWEKNDPNHQPGMIVWLLHTFFSNWTSPVAASTITQPVAASSITTFLNPWGGNNLP